jgi:hypothetical protein
VLQAEALHNSCLRAGELHKQLHNAEARRELSLGNQRKTDMCPAVTMSALGQKQTFAMQTGMSALPRKADICSALADVRFGPKTERHRTSSNYTIMG